MRVRTVMPPTPGEDFNDVLVALRGPAVSDRAEPVRFIVVDETEPEQRRIGSGGRAGPSADDGRKALRDILDRS